MTRLVRTRIPQVSGVSENNWSTEENPSTTIREGTPEPDLLPVVGDGPDRIRIQAEDLPQCNHLHGVGRGL